MTAVGVTSPRQWISNAVYGFFDAAQKWLTQFPPNPITDLLSGALLLVRRTFFNQAPTVNPVQLTGQLTGAITGTIGAVDPDGDPITYKILQAPLDGELAIAANGSYTYDPGPSFGGADGFVVAAADTYWGINLLDLFRPASTDVFTSVKQGTAPVLTYNFTYDEGASLWNQDAKASLEWSAFWLGQYVDPEFEVTLDYLVKGSYDTSGRTLASAGSDSVNTTDPGFYMTIVQDKIINEDSDANGGKADGRIDFNFGQTWGYFDSVGATQYDFESTAMHELIHSFGFLSDFSGTPACNVFVCDADSKPSSTLKTNWTDFDQYITDQNGLSAFYNGNLWKPTFTPNLTGDLGGLFFSGTDAKAAFGNDPVPLYTPDPYSDGSSISHLDDDYFYNTTDPDAPNYIQLMNANTDTGPGLTILSAVEIGILQDLGYQMGAATSAAATAAAAMLAAS